MLHLTKVAYGAQSLDEVLGWFADRGPESRHTTRYKPKRHEEIAGGSLYWILKHQLVARTPILGFEERLDGKTDMVLSSAIVPVRPLAKRAHQGWRYLEAANAPADWLPSDAIGAPLPPKLVLKLAQMGLI